MKKIFIYLTIPIFFLISCQSGKYVTEFKTIKKGIDTLEILPVYAIIKTIDKNRNYYDHQLEKKVEIDISNQVNKVLGHKYLIIQSGIKNQNDSLLNIDFNKLITILNSQKNPIGEIKIPASFEELTKTSENRYFLMLFLKAQYSAADYYSSMPGREVIYIDPFIDTFMKQYVILFDNFEKKILYYTEFSSKGSASIASSVEQNTLKSIKSIYYK